MHAIKSRFGVSHEWLLIPSQAGPTAWATATVLGLAALATSVVLPGTEAVNDIGARAEFIRNHHMLWIVTWLFVWMAMLLLCGFLVRWGLAVQRRDGRVAVVLALLAALIYSIAIAIQVFCFPDSLVSWHLAVRLAAPVFATTLYSVSILLLAQYAASLITYRIGLLVSFGGMVLATGALLFSPLLMAAGGAAMWGLLPALCLYQAVDVKTQRRCPLDSLGVD